MKKLVAIGGDVFAGLFSAGVQQAGFEVPVHLENSNYGMKTCHLNFPKIETRNKFEDWNVKSLPKNVDLMFCNPPCAIWSQAGASGTDMQKNWKDDPRISWHRNLTETGLALKPKAFIIESVLQAWEKGRDFIMGNVDLWAKAGYSVTIVLQNNLYIGGTQYRKRMFFVAHKHPLVFPPFTQARTLGQLLKHVPREPAEMLSRKVAAIWKKCNRPTDSLALSLRNTMNKMDNYKGPKIGFFTKRLKFDRTPPVLLGYSTMLHPTEPRFLSRAEWLILNGAPLTWKSSCQGMGSLASELARAVHIGPGKWIATAVKLGLLKSPISMATFSLVNFLDPEHPFMSGLMEAARIADAPKLPKIPGERHSRVSRQPQTPIHLKANQVIKATEDTSKDFIRRLLKDGRLSAPEIVAQVHANFKNRKTTVADVAYHKGHMKKEGLL